MELTYTNTAEDYAAYADHYARHDPRAARMRVWRLVLCELVALFLAACGLAMSVMPFLYAGLAMALIVPFIVGPMFRSAARRQAASMVRESSGRLIGEKRARIADDGLHVEGPGGSMHLKFDAIGRIAATPTHLYIVSGMICVAVIPARGVGGTALADFREELRRRTSAAEAA